MDTTTLFLALAVAAYFLLAAALRRLWALSNHAEMSAFFSRGAFAFWSWPMLLYWLPCWPCLVAATLYASARRCCVLGRPRPRRGPGHARRPGRAAATRRGPRRAAGLDRKRPPG